MPAASPSSTSHNVWLRLVGVLWLCPPTTGSILGSGERVAGMGWRCRDSPIPPGRESSPKKLLPTGWRDRESSETRAGVQSYRPKTFQNHWKRNTSQILFRRLSCTDIPSRGRISSCKRNRHCHWCEGLCVKNKNTVLSKTEKGSWVRSVNPCQWQTWSATWRRRCCNRTVEGWAGVSRHVTGMTSHGSRAGAAEPAAGQSLECHLHELQSNLLAHPSGKR